MKKLEQKAHLTKLIIKARADRHIAFLKQIEAEIKQTLKVSACLLLTLVTIACGGGPGEPESTPLSSQDLILNAALEVASNNIGGNTIDPEVDVTAWLMDEADGFYDFCGKKWVEGEDVGNGTLAPYSGPSTDGCTKENGTQIFVFEWRSEVYQCLVLAHELMHAIGEHVFGDSDPLHQTYNFDAMEYNSTNLNADACFEGLSTEGGFGAFGETGPFSNHPMN